MFCENVTRQKTSLAPFISISYVELSLTAIAAVINPLLFVTDLLIELGLYSFGVKALSGPPRDQSFPNCLNPFG
jgi:hypothetical protein